MVNKAVHKLFVHCFWTESWATTSCSVFRSQRLPGFTTCESCKYISYLCLVFSFYFEE